MEQSQVHEQDAFLIKLSWKGTWYIPDVDRYAVDEFRFELIQTLNPSSVHSVDVSSSAPAFSLYRSTIYECRHKPAAVQNVALWYTGCALNLNGGGGFWCSTTSAISKLSNGTRAWVRYTWETDILTQHTSGSRPLVCLQAPTLLNHSESGRNQLQKL